MELLKNSKMLLISFSSWLPFNLYPCPSFLSGHSSSQRQQLCLFSSTNNAPCSILQFVLLVSAFMVVPSPVLCMKSHHEHLFEQHQQKAAPPRNRFSADSILETARNLRIWQLQSSAQSRSWPATSMAGDNDDRQLPKIPNLTKNQKAYLDSLNHCDSLSCISSSKTTTTGIRSATSFLNNQTQNLRFRRQITLTGQGGLVKLNGVLRREYRDMPDADRLAFHRAMNAMKRNLIDGVSKYDLLIQYHRPEQSPGAHFGAAFLPFHRELLKQLELGLRMEVPLAYLPYWDPRLDSTLPRPSDSVLWTGDFLGNGNGTVVEGPFKNWRILGDPLVKAFPTSGPIQRNAGSRGSLYSHADVDALMERKTLKELIFCHDSYFEMVHGDVHRWVGGHMVNMRISPNDPAFFLLHAFVDYLWEVIRTRWTTWTEREKDYVSDAEACTRWSRANATMKPFPIRNIDGLSNGYTSTFYHYKESPQCDEEDNHRSHPSCNSVYLFCNRRQWKPLCTSKVKLGGNCDGLQGLDACYRGECSPNGICVPKPQRRKPLPVLNGNGQRLIGEFGSLSDSVGYARAFEYEPGTVEVWDETGEKCRSLCLQGAYKYVPCKAARLQRSMNFAFTKSQAASLIIDEVSGIPRRDPFIFACHASSIRLPGNLSE